jgi:hypothetical protein
MKKEFADRIDKAIGDRRDAVQNAETARDRLADAEQQFVSQFYVACDAMIDPAMRESPTYWQDMIIAARLRSRTRVAQRGRAALPVG